MLSSREKEKYDRHLRLQNVGEEGQLKLKAAAVLVVGAGGLGCPILQYLTAAGVGRIGVIDFDSVDASNLQRQILFSEDQLGENKAIAAKQKLSKLNSLIELEAYPEKLNPENALRLFSEYDIIVDGSDNFSTRYLVNDACVILGKPLVYGAIFKFEGQISVFNFQGGPSYRCLFPEAPNQGEVPSCSEVGVIGVLPGLIGTRQANEVIKIILEIGDVMSGRLEVFDALGARSTQLSISRNEQIIEETRSKEVGFELLNYDQTCEAPAAIEDVKWSQVDLKDFELVVDIREQWEQPRLNIDGISEIPMGNVLSGATVLPKDERVLIVCQSGIRSKKLIDHLQTEFGYNNLVNLSGGVKTMNLNNG